MILLVSPNNNAPNFLGLTWWPLHFYGGKTLPTDPPIVINQTLGHRMSMASALCFINISQTILIFLLPFSLLASTISPVHSLQSRATNQTDFHPEQELNKLKMIRTHLDKINKPALHTIQSPDGDIIDCVLSHQQPAFDHPNLQGQIPMDPPERPQGHKQPRTVTGSFQLWNMNGENCPEGTVPIRRTTEEDMLRATSFQMFGRKVSRWVRRETSSDGHEHAVGYVTGDHYFGAKASINVWAPRVADQYEFSLSQMWVISGSFGDDLNTIEAGWQACLSLCYKILVFYRCLHSKTKEEQKRKKKLKI